MIVTVEQLKEQLNATVLPGEEPPPPEFNDDALLARKIAAAQGHIERLLGFKIEDTYGGEDQDEIPAPLVEAVLQLAAHWYENRETSLIGVSGQELPFGVWAIVNEYREWSFGG